MITTEKQRIESLTAAGAWGDQTLHGLLDEHAGTRPQQPAVLDQPNREDLTGDAPRQLTWGQLAWASESLAWQLHAAGIGSDDRVMVQLPNIVELLVVYYAASRLGAIVSPLPVQYGSHELRHGAAALDAAAMISLPRFRDVELAAAARRALPGLQVLVMGEDLVLDAAPGNSCVSGQTEDANRVLTICWTSGTTGTPKGVPRSHNMWLASARRSIEACAYVAEDRLLNPFPMVNMSALGGFVFPAALLGSAIALHHPLDPQVYLQQLQEEKISFTIAPPALLNQLARSPELWRGFDFSALRRIGSGSAPLSPWMIETFAAEFGVEVVNIYGSNEGIALFSTPETAAAPAVRATMFARPAPATALATKVADPDSGRELTEPGERGELLVSGATVFDGYWRYDSSALFSGDGFFRTGDLVEICGDRGDYYRIVGRCKDIINRGGMKISPLELDIALEQYPGVAEAAVCAYPDERLGEKICACLVLESGSPPPTLAQLQEYLLAQGFAKFKLPERLHSLPQLPRNAVGKVQRFLLQEALQSRSGDTV